MRKLFSVLAALMLCATSLAAQEAASTVLLVRHAEKAAEPANDPPLSAEGRARTEALYEVVRSSGVSVIYSSNRVRTLETARYVANKLQIPVIEVAIPSGGADAWALEVANRIRKDARGKVAMVVGHSNTYAPVIRAMGGPSIEEIPETRYDDIFVLTLQEGFETRLIRGKYGKRWEK